MGVYIKGMEMPKTGEYRCVIRQWKRGEPLTMDLYGEEELCGTIVPVPPHGRCIDAGELERKIGENIDKAKSRGQGAYGWWYACNVAEDFVLSAPTIIEAEEGE